MTEQKRIEAYSISEFADKIQQGVLEGYRLDLESNENYPVQLGVVFICGLVKVDQAFIIDRVLSTSQVSSIEKHIESVLIEDAKQPTQRGRPSKK